MDSDTLGCLCLQSWMMTMMMMMMMMMTTTTTMTLTILCSWMFCGTCCCNFSMKNQAITQSSVTIFSSSTGSMFQSFFLGDLSNIVAVEQFPPLTLAFLNVQSTSVFGKLRQELLTPKWRLCAQFGKLLREGFVHLLLLHLSMLMLKEVRGADVTLPQSLRLCWNTPWSAQFCPFQKDALITKLPFNSANSFVKLGISFLIFQWCPMHRTGVSGCSIRGLLPRARNSKVINMAHLRRTNVDVQIFFLLISSNFTYKTSMKS